MADEIQRCAVLYPSVAEAARRVGTDRIGLIDFGGTSAIAVDRVGITYSSGLQLGEPSAATQLTCRINGPGLVPATPLPEVVTRVSVERAALDQLPEFVADVPPDALPVVTTTWALSKLSLKRRLVFSQVLVSAGERRPVAWVSIEGVGVAPGVDTFGDRPASGHSIIGIGVFDGARHDIESVGRCWARGTIMSWLI